MRRLLGASLLFIAAAANAALSNLTVVVKSPAGTPLAGVNVAAVSFVNGQPDASVSQIGLTDAGGTLNFDGTGIAHTLTVGNVYQIVASSQGFLPGFLDQFGGNPPTVTAAAPGVSTPTVNIVLSSAGVSSLGEIDVNVTNASPNVLVFGQLSLKTGGGASAYGITNTGVAGAGNFQFFNVHSASAGVYQASAFDPIKNRSASVQIAATLNSGATLSVGAPLNFTNAPAPVANISQTQASGQGGRLSVYGVVIDTAGTPIPYLGLNFQSQYKDAYNQTFNDWRGAQTDQNGVFQIYDLRAGTTYYTNISGGCNPSSGGCYQGSQSTSAASFGAAPGINDFVYNSTSTVLSLKFQLTQIAAGNGVLKVYVQDQFGKSFPQAGVGLFPDGMGWQTAPGAACAGPFASNPGFKSLNAQTSATGYLLLTGLPSGNYQLYAWSAYGQAAFNGGPDGKLNYGPCSTSGIGADDRRLTIDTTTPSGMGYVYDNAGNAVYNNVSSVTIVVNVATGSLTGLVQGSLKFPSVVDLSSSPISIVLYPQCGNGQTCGGGGFTGFSSASTGPVINYSIPVSSGQSYYMQVTSDFWGAVFPGGNQPQPNLTTSSAAVVNMNFFPAGKVVGSMRKPDGSIFVPPSSNQGGNPNVTAQGNNSWGNTQISNDGSFSLGGLLPGQYTLLAQNYSGGSSFPFTTKQPAPKLTIQANQTISQDMYLSDAVTVQPIAGLGSLPPLTILTSCPANSDCPPETYEAYALPQGTPFTPATVAGLLAGGGGGTPGLFPYSPVSGQANICSGGYLPAPGFCTSPLAASKSGSAFDFYLMRKGGFDSGNLVGGTRPYFVIETSTKNVIVNAASAVNSVFNPNGGGSGSTTTVQNVNLTPNPSLNGLAQATLAGTVTATNMINLRQFQQLAGNFEAFLQYLPIVWAYDSSGTLKSAGLVVPYPPNEKPKDTALNQAVASGNFQQFQNLTGPAPTGWGALGYEIRGLTAGQTYNLVVTTPNYPPFKTSVVLGVANSTKTVDVNLDSNPGVSISGLVQSTSAAAIGGAQVTVKAPGYRPTTLTTDGAGNWSLSGLGAGRYNVLAVAAGYAQGAQDVDVSGSGAVVVPAFSLPAVNASISGTVYTNNPVCPAGATCSAFGKTVLQGVTVLAYDDTINVQSPTASLPLYRAATDSSGTYKIIGLSTSLISGTTNYHRFKVFVNAPGYYVLNQSTEVPGAVQGFDFALKPKPLDVNVFGHQVGANYEFQITNFQDFSGGNAWIGASPFVLATSTPLPQNSFVQRVDADGNPQLFLDYSTATLTAGTVYTLHIAAQPNDPRAPLVVKEVTFGLSLPHGVCESIDQALIGDESGVNSQGLPDNNVPLDISGGAGGNGSGLSLPVGGVIPTLSTAIPAMCMTETDAAASPQATLGLRTSGLSLSAFLSGVYNVTLSSINYTAKGVDMTLAYNQTGADLNDLAVYTFDSPSQQWKLVPGLQTIDPVRGTISVKGLKSLASVLSVAGTGTGVTEAGTASNQRIGLMALSDGQGYRPDTRVAGATDSGLFAVLRPSQVGGGTYSGTTVRIYNFPNPFDLQSKTITLAPTSNCTGSATSILTNGTVIKYEIPAGVSGHAVIRLYTLSGRLVREIDAGDVSPSSCSYIQWDGRNRSGQAVANGVYYGLLSVAGTKQSSGTFKLAVIK
ncbi:MAG: carboxypeptidase regulatory-like domain-containing protein [Elusimicrobia bacterium]|nr:carboxypeptidase regulatory-like domain-containing protein [Elusimicrobiota bacterium]